MSKLNPLKISLLAIIATLFSLTLLLAHPAQAASSSSSKSIATSKLEAVSISLIAAGGGIGKPGPIYSKIKVVDGKNVCGKKNDHPKVSDHNPKGHIDSECCLDPDETPNSNCYYPPEKYGAMLQKYLRGVKK